MMQKGKGVAKQVLFSIGLGLGGLAAILPMLWLLRIILVKWQEGFSLLTGNTVYLFLTLILFSPVLLPFGIMLLVRSMRVIKTMLKT